MINVVKIVFLKEGLNGGFPNSLFDKNVGVNSEFGKKSANSVKCSIVIANSVKFTVVIANSFVDTMFLPLSPPSPRPRPRPRTPFVSPL